MSAVEPALILAENTLVRVDREPIERALARDGKFSLAEALWHRDQGQDGALPFAGEMRRLFGPDPAHVLDTSDPNLLAWRFIDFDQHPFVLDGEDAGNLRLGAIRQAPARIAAEQTYGVVVAERLPACFTVSILSRVYRRAMFPFLDRRGRVSRVVTLIRPLTAGVTLAAVSSA